MATLAFYYGTGFDDKSGNGQDLTEQGTVPQSSTPTPNYSSNWLMDNQDQSGGQNYLSIPTALSSTASQGLIEFYVRIPSGQLYAVASIWTKFNDFSDREFAYVDNTGTVGWIYYNGGFPDIFSHSTIVTLDQNHLIRLEFDGVSTRFYVDGVLISTGNPAPVRAYTTFRIGQDGLGIYPTSEAHPYINGFLISNNPADVFPGPLPPQATISNVLANAQLAMLINIQGQDESTGVQIYPDLPTVLSNTIQAIAVDINGNSL